MTPTPPMDAPAPRPPHWSEQDRLRSLRAYEILDTDREQVFDDFVLLAQLICGTPISAINLIEDKRQWFKAEVGLGVRETPLEHSICRHALLQEGTMVVSDTAADPRFECNPLVTGEPHLRFYAGALLRDENGLPLGTLCVLDHAPRPMGLSIVQREALEALARQVMTQLELRRALKDRAESQRSLSAAHRRTEEILASIVDPFYVVDARRVATFANAALLAHLGRTEREVIGRDLVEAYDPAIDIEAAPGMRMLGEVLRHRRPMQIELRSAVDGAWMDVRAYPMSDGGVSVYYRNIDGRKRLEAELNDALTRLQEQLVEKELLMLETHHRVKNSLQMVQSLLSLQARAIADPAISVLMQQSAARVRTFGALHETLYHIADGAGVDIGSYLEKLVQELNEGIGGTQVGRPVRLVAQSTRWPSSEASTVGLVLTELVTNALKYGRGAVTVSFVRDGSGGGALLTVEDEGRDLDADFDPEHTSGLGMRLIRRLLRDQGATLSVDRSVPHTRMVVTLAAPVLPKAP